MDMEILMIGLGAMTLITMLVFLTVAVAAYLQFRRTEGEPGNTSGGEPAYPAAANANCHDDGKAIPY